MTISVCCVVLLSVLLLVVRHALRVPDISQQTTLISLLAHASRYELSSYSSSSSSFVTSLLPSCSTLNPNLTLSLLHFAGTTQHENVHADCQEYHSTGHCWAPLSHSAHRPRWLVWAVESGPELGGGGGLADRTKGLLTILSLSLLVGRAFAVHAVDFIPFTEVYDRGLLHWIDWAGIQPELRQGNHVHVLDWISTDGAISKDDTDWLSEWDRYDVVRIKSNMNGFPDLLDNLSLMRAFRAFGFHATTEKGDLDMYWQCLMDFALTYTPHVLDVLNPILMQLGRPRLLTWAQERQAAGGDVFAHPNASAGLPTASSSRLYCAQLRMGSHGGQTTNDKQVGFRDVEGFLQHENIPRVLTQLSSLVAKDLTERKQLMQGRSGPKSLTCSLFITADSDISGAGLSAELLSCHLLQIPGRIGHVDQLHAVKGNASAIREVWVTTLVTHHLLGECDMATIYPTGYGTSARWRTRNRHLGGAAFVSAAYRDTFVIGYNSSIVPYAHRRGSGGRENPQDYRAIKADVRAIIEHEVLVNLTERASLQPQLYETFQSSAELPMQPPRDPMSQERTPRLGWNVLIERIMEEVPHVGSRL